MKQRQLREHTASIVGSKLQPATLVVHGFTAQVVWVALYSHGNYIMQLLSMLCKETGWWWRRHTIKHFHFEPRHMGSASPIPAMIPVYLQNNLMCQQFIKKLYKIRIICGQYQPSFRSIITLISHFEPWPHRKWLSEALHELWVWYNELRLT